MNWFEFCVESYAKYAIDDHNPVNLEHIVFVDRSEDKELNLFFLIFYSSNGQIRQWVYPFDEQGEFDRKKDWKNLLNRMRR